jgi:membrane protease YdiL (CAAX protease family)
MQFVKQLLAVVAVALIGSRVVAAADGHPWLILASGLATAVLTAITYAWVVRRTEDRVPAELARPGAGAALTRGALIGVAMCAAVIGNLALLGDYRVYGGGSPSGAAGLVGFMAAAAVTEELLFRGLLFRFAERRFGTWLALAASGLVFGLSHLANPHATVWGAIAIAVEAGFMLAAAYVATRTLWVPIGLHFGWNFALGGIFGAEVSGNGTSRGLLDAVTSGPALVSGGEFGPEASLYAVAAGLVLTTVFLVLARRRGHLVPRRRSAPVQPAATLAR